MPGRGLARWVLLAVIGAALIGCKELPTRFVPVLSPQDRALAAQIPVHREPLPRGTYLIVGRVEGLSCQITHDDPYRVSEDNAIEELQRATFRTGGDAVMEVSCEHFGRHQDPRRCIRSVVCRGIAVQMKPARGTDRGRHGVRPAARTRLRATERRHTPADLCCLIDTGRGTMMTPSCHHGLKLLSIRRFSAERAIEQLS